MTNAEKLAAIERAEAGSYNFAPARDVDEDFQALVVRARQLSREHGYFMRCVGGGRRDIVGLLVTIGRAG